MRDDRGRRRRARRVVGASGETITIEDDRGTVELDGPAVNVVSLEWGLTENLLTLGVTPVGAADVAGYNTWDTVVPLDESTPDVGMRGEPSLDAIAALEPDLVVTTTDLPAEVIEQIEAEYPVIALRGSDASDPIAKMRRTLEILGEATGTSDAADAALADFDAKVADAKARLDEAGLAGASFTMADGWLADGAVSIRMYTPGSYLGALAAEIGLQNAWTGEGDPDYGLAQTDVEGLTGLGDLHFLYVGNDTDGGDAFTGRPGRQRDLGAAALRRRGQHHPPARRHLAVRRTGVGRRVHRRDRRRPDRA